MKRSPLSARATTANSLSGRRVAITGAARGIGLSIARAVAAEGATVAIGDLDGELAATAASSVPGAAGFEVDVSDRESFARFLDAAEDQLGPIDVLVNNAGVMHLGLFLDHDEARTRRMVEVNLVGTLNGMQLALPRMLARGQGHVVNVASTAGKIGVMGGSVYCATKHAVVGLSEAVRAELGDTPVCISVVMPGPVNTELAHGISGVRGVGLIEPEEVAAAVVGALGSRRFEVFVPGVAGVMLRALAVLPRRVRDPLERAGRMHDAFTRVDEDARASYEERVAGRSTA